jgi:glycosyltransferase involved in cell wall biosynthesis
MAHWLGSAIESVLQQTDGDFELLIGDNASTDSTTELLAQYRDPRIRVFRHARNLGAYTNVNFLLRETRGEWVHVLCADDMMSPICLAAVRAHAGQANVVAVNSVKDEARVVRDPEAVRAVAYAASDFLRCLNARPVPLGLIQLFSRRAVLAAIGFYQEISMADDYGTDSYAGWVLFLEHGCVHISTPLTYERYHATQGRFSQGAYKGMRDYFRFLSDHDVRLRGLPGYPREVKVFKDRVAAQHLWGGLRRLLLNRDPTYLRETRRILHTQNYHRLPLTAMLYTLKERFWPRAG